MSTTLAPSFLDSLRAALLDRLASLSAREARIDDRLRRDEALDPDWPDRASALAEEEVLVGLDDEARSAIDALRGALGRLEAGTFGVCVRCGEHIDEERLVALPTAATCAACAA
jgi:RNA polymerase-binding transcription factor DksA